MAATHKKTLTVSVRPGSSLSNFPVWCIITDDTDIGGRAQSDASDVRFYTTGGVELDWRKVAWTISGGECDAICMVLVPSILSSADLQIEIHYGGGADTPAYSSTLSITGLVGGWDMESASPADWSGQGANATGRNSPGTATGKIGTCVDFDGTNDYLSVAHDSDHSASTGDICIECWVYLDSVSGARTFLTKGRVSAELMSNYTLRSNGQKLEFYHFSSASVFNIQGSNNNVFSTATWYHVAVRGTFGTGFTLYLNGSSIASSNTFGDMTRTPLTGSSELWIGDNIQGERLDGRLDDMRLWLGTIPSADALAYEVAQTNSPGSWGAESSLLSPRRPFLAGMPF
jgi:hypothetical protein